MSDDREVTAQALARPWTYAPARLGMKLHPKQAAVLRDLWEPLSRVLFRCGNEVGKTSHVAVAWILYQCEVLKGLTVSTAGVRRQVEEQLVPALKSYSHLFPRTWQFTDDAILVDGVKRYMGFTAANQGNFQGFHNLDGPLTVILDESAAIRDEIFWAAEERCNPTHMLVMGSPLDPTGLFYKYASDLASFYRQHKLSQMECLQEDGYWLRRETVQRKIDKWGPDHPIVLSSVYADFCLKVADALLSLREWDACLENPPEHVGRRRHVFLDFAAGGAENVIGVAHGNKAWIEAAWRERNTMAAVGEFLARLNRLRQQIGLQPEEVEGDADGLGIVMCQALAEGGWPVQQFHGGAKPLSHPEYRSRIAEVWTEGTNAIRRREWILPRDEELKAQIINRKGGRDGKGFLKIEEKKELAARGVQSPDRADALLGAMAPCPMLPRSAGPQIPDNDEPGQGLPGASFG